MDISQIHKETGAAWNEIAAGTYWHGESGAEETIKFLRSGGNYLFESERELLGDLKPWCKRAIHLQCSGGNDALSLLQHGAAEVVGVDISETFIAAARRKTEALGANATWYCSDILETTHELDGTADLIYTGKGALCWMMDLPAWARVVARLLVPGGRFFVHEGHPLDWVWDMNATEYVFDPEHGNYFSDKLREGLFGTVRKATPRSRQTTLGDIINSLIAAGLTIDYLMEYPEPFWEQFPNIPEETLCRLPHTFTLMASKR